MSADTWNGETKILKACKKNMSASVKWVGFVEFGGVSGRRHVTTVTGETEEEVSRRIAEVAKLGPRGVGLRVNTPRSKNRVRRRYWSRNFPSCRDCKSRYWPHKGHGYCSSCYGKHYDAGELEGTQPWAERQTIVPDVYDPGPDVMAAESELTQLSAYSNWLRWHIDQHYPDLLDARLAVQLSDRPAGSRDDLLALRDMLAYLACEADGLGLHRVWADLENLWDRVHDFTTKDTDTDT